MEVYVYHVRMRKVIMKSLLKACVLTWALAMGYVVMSHTTPTGSVDSGPDAIMAIRPHAEGSPAAVLARMGDRCWQGAAPADMEGKMPGHVIVRFKEDGPGGKVVVRGERIVGKALDQIFNHNDWHLDVIAFCR